MRSQKVMTTCSSYCYSGPKMIAAPERCLKMQHKNGAVGVCVSPAAFAELHMLNG